MALILLMDGADQYVKAVQLVFQIYKSAKLVPTLMLCSANGISFWMFRGDGRQKRGPVIIQSGGPGIWVANALPKFQILISLVVDALCGSNIYYSLINTFNPRHHKE